MTENNKGMRTIIFGAGAIGSVVAGHLALAGNDVVLIGRPGHMNAIRQQGLRLITPTGTHILKMPAVTTPNDINFGSDDVVLLCLKSQDTDEALRSLRLVVEDVPVFCLQNGVSNEETATQYFPRAYGVMVMIGAVFTTNGEVTCRRTPPGQLIMGRYPTGTDELVQSVAEELRGAGFYVMVSSDVMPYKWGKMMGNLANAIGAITDARGDVNNRIAKAARDEAREILAQAHIRWVPTDQIAKEMAQAWPESAQKPIGTLETKEQSSTWQSLNRQQGTVETDFLNGEIARLAKQLGKQAPINEKLLHITQEMAANRERPGKYTPDELCRLVGLG